MSFRVPRSITCCKTGRDQKVPKHLVVKTMHVLVLPVHEQEVDPADTDVHQLGVVPLAGVEDALVAEVLALKSEKKRTIIKTYFMVNKTSALLVT